MKRNVLWCALALAALCAPLAAWPALATRPAQGRANPAPFALMKDINTAPQPHSSMDFGLIFGVVNNTLLFSANTPQTGRELWATDGTANGTRIVKDINPGDSSSINGTSSSVLKNQLLFAADDGARSPELWASDGTKGGTRLLKELSPGVDSNGLSNFIASDDRAFFTVPVSQTAQALWASDGTPEGTKPLHTFRGLSGNQVLAGGTLFFVAAETGDDLELWTSDGTAGGTHMLQDLNPGPTSSNPREIVKAGDKLYLSAYKLGAGIELWAAPIAALHDQPTPTLAPGQPTATPNKRRVLLPLIQH